MRPRTIIMALAGVLFVNTLIVLGALWWAHEPQPAGAVAQVSVSDPKPPAPPNRAPALKETVTVAAPKAPPTAGATATSAWASIDSPTDWASVPRNFSATGRCGALPPGQQLILVVQTGRVYSPKVPSAVIDNGKWTGSCREYGVLAGGNFTLCVFMVSEEGLAEIGRWHAEGKATGHYPPYRDVPGGECLARLTLRVAR